MPLRHQGLHPARAELSNEPSPDPTGSLLYPRTGADSHCPPMWASLARGGCCFLRWGGKGGKPHLFHSWVGRSLLANRDRWRYGEENNRKKVLKPGSVYRRKLMGIKIDVGMCNFMFRKRPPKKVPTWDLGFELGFRSPATYGSHIAHNGHSDLYGFSLNPTPPRFIGFNKSLTRISN